MKQQGKKPYLGHLPDEMSLKLDFSLIDCPQVLLLIDILSCEAD